MSLNSLADFKQVLGVGDIYADSLLQACLDSADDIVLGIVTQNKYSVIAHERSGTVGTIYLDRPSSTYVGESVVLSNCGSAFNGSKTVTNYSNSDPFTVSFTMTSLTYPRHAIVPSGSMQLDQYIVYANVPEVCEAAMAISVDIWMSRQGTLGQQGVDFQPAPYKLGRGMLQRVMGLLGGYVDVRSMIG